MVAIYPVEGTFVATHPACISSEISAEEQAAASIFRDYLLSEEGQSMALAFGLRPVNDAVAIGAPIDASYGVDPSQPTTVFAPPSVETVYAVQDVWQSARKPINLVMLLDTSGSMSGRKIDNMKQAAAQFVQQMGEEDRISLIDFHSYPDVKAEYVLIAEGRDQIVGIIEEMVDGGDTTLFDAVGKAGDIIATTTTPDMTNVIIVLTDGQDTGSLVWEFDDELAQHATANDTTIYAIAYGGSASEEVLAELARMGNGNYYLSDEASIAGIYEEMSAAFGGSVGVGR